MALQTGGRRAGGGGGGVSYTLHTGDCLNILPTLPADSIDTCITDPPYGLEFMGKDWDHGVPGVRFWQEVYRVLKPGAMLLAFGGTRTHHRLMVAIEDAGFEIRDCLMWLYGCLSEDSEILTSEGFKPYHRIMVGDTVMCYNKGNDTYQWERVQDVVTYEYEDTAYRIQSDTTDQIVSRNHRCLVEREGELLFQFAEHAAREREIRVPILEDVPALLKALPLSQPHSGATKQALRPGLHERGNIRTKKRARRQETAACDAGVSSLRPDVLAAQGTRREGRQAHLQQTMQRGAAWRGMEGARPQSTGGMDGGSGTLVFREDERGEQSGLEGRRNLPQAQGELRQSEHQVCALPARVYQHGPQGWLCNGASASRGAGNRTPIKTLRSGASYQPQRGGQPAREFDVVLKQPTPQAVRASRFTRSHLATITPIEYKGIVWCVRVPSGAFVARRNGKAFVTGNSGFPKSHNISKAIDKAAGAEREVVGINPNFCENRVDSIGTDNGIYGGAGPDKGKYITAPATPDAQRWHGYGTALKPAYEPIVLAMKPLDGTFAQNALAWGTAGLWIDGCRIAANDKAWGSGNRNSWREAEGRTDRQRHRYGEPDSNPHGRWPANVVLDEVAAGLLDEQAGERPSGGGEHVRSVAGSVALNPGHKPLRNTSIAPSTGGASRFFYCAKASRAERNAGLDGLPRKERDDHNLSSNACARCGLRVKANGSGDKCECGDLRETVKLPPPVNHHPTVKPLDLMRWLCRLTKTPAGGVVLDPFMGSGSTGIAAVMEGRDFIGIELDAEYTEIARRRIDHAARTPRQLSLLEALL